MNEQLMNQLLEDLQEACTNQTSILYYIYQNEQELLYTSFNSPKFIYKPNKPLYFERDDDTRLQIPLETAEIEYNDTEDEEEYIIKSNGLTYYIGIL